MRIIARRGTPKPAAIPKPLLRHATPMGMVAMVKGGWFAAQTARCTLHCYFCVRVLLLRLRSAAYVVVGDGIIQ